VAAGWAWWRVASEGELMVGTPEDGVAGESFGASPEKNRRKSFGSGGGAAAGEVVARGGE
ncbi:hypothetical protein Tco_1089204, partial [Tanacetum coccineum]